MECLYFGRLLSRAILHILAMHSPSLSLALKLGLGKIALVHDLTPVKD